MPWANVFFSEKTICNVMKRLAKDDPFLLDAYPGLVNNPQKVKDLRKYGDLNSITHKRFRRLAIEAGFTIDSFVVFSSGQIFFQRNFSINS